MKKASAPNQRLETIGNLNVKMRGKDDDEHLFELLQLLGMSKPDADGTAIFKKERLIPEATLCFYVSSAVRYEQFKKTGVKFSEFSQAYWAKYPKDRLMQLHA